MQTDESEKLDTLPRAELNPLFNPILGQHLGRWAEVYYTAAPEDREGAVMELLRELQAEQSPEGEMVATEEQAPHFAPLDQNGEPLPVSRVDAPVAQAADLHQPQSYQSDLLRTFTPLEDPPDSGPVAKLLKVPRSYRYAALALTFVVLSLAYAKWRGSAAEPQSTPPNLRPMLVRESTRTSLPIATAVDLQASHTKVEQTGTKTLPKEGTDFPARQNQSDEIAAALRKDASSRTRLIPVSPDNGSADLAVAKSYLNGSDSKIRNSTEAAKWLWKAVGKQNAEASGLLSGLYLKGDGVPKNCEQARLLLDAAARKGLPGAGEELRHLPAFGCQ